MVKEAMNQFTTDDPLPPAVVNRMQEDDALLSRGQADLFTSRNRPKIHTSDYKMVATGSADTVTLDSGVTFDVGGVIFSTDDMVSRSFVIPDDTTKYLYAAMAEDCGEAVDWEADPIERKRTVNMTLEDSSVESTPTKMLVLKAVKGAAGETPVVTLYANEGWAVVGCVLTGQIEGLWVNRSDDDTLTITAGWCHLCDGSGTDHLVKLTTDQALDVALSGTGVGYVYVDSVGIVSWSTTAPTRDAAKGGYYDSTGDLRYLGAWPYSSAALTMAHRNDRNVYFSEDVGLYSGLTTVYVDLDLSNYVPSIEGVSAVIFCHAEEVGTRFLARVKGDVSSGRHILEANETSGKQSAIFVMPTNAEAVIEITGGVNATGIIIAYVGGYRDVR